MTAEDIKAGLDKFAKVEDAMFLQRFFKTGKGQYGEGDVFIGVRVPQTRMVCRQFKALPLDEVQKLLNSKVHEHRLAGLIILTLQYSKGDKQAIYDFYLKNVYKGRVNNWDLVDVTCPLVVGAYLLDKPRDVLFELAKSDSLWQRRVAIISTATFIRKGDPGTTLELAEILLHDKEDLMHKAVGWMLREMGSKCEIKLLTDFLDEHAHEMPRTMLRYSLEHLPKQQRLHYMSQKSGR